MKKASLALSVASICLGATAQTAEQEWWFDVEVILFERHLDPSKILEQFAASSFLPPQAEATDLLTPYLKPDISYLLAGLDYCRTSKRQEQAQKRQQDFAFPQPVAQDEVIQEPTDTDNQVLVEQGLASISQEIQQQEHGLDLTSTEPTSQPSEQLASNPEALNSLETVPQETARHEAALQEIAPQEQQITDTEATELEPQLTETNQAEPIDEPAPEKARPPIQISWLEWQIPSQLPCAYSEQIDPILTLPELSHTVEFESATPNQQPDLWLDTVPVTINGIEWLEKGPAFLLPSDTFRMQKLFNSIKKQRDISPILHLSWRQQVEFGRDNAQSFRLFAGKNYANEFDLNGRPLAVTQALETELAPATEAGSETDILFEQLLPQDSETGLQAQPLEVENTEILAELATKEPDLISQIEQALSERAPIDFRVHANPVEAKNPSNTSNQSVSDIWQLDGLLTVYLRRIGRVPYLHIDGNFDYRQPIYPEQDANIGDDTTQEPLLQPSAEAYLQSVNFNQLRRVISKQVHYFDHPLFGMIVRIHRFRWPQPDEELETEAAD
ncbi:CsiV family protein [Paraglaciecola aestuariivivens]